MSQIVEIYAATGGQSIQDGDLDISYSIASKYEPKSDAISHCRHDPTIRKVAHYTVKDDGSFKNLFAYDNSNALTIVFRGPKRQIAEWLPDIKRKPPTSKAKKKTRPMGRLVGSFKD